MSNCAGLLRLVTHSQLHTHLNNYQLYVDTVRVSINHYQQTRANPEAALQTALSLSQSVILFLPQLYSGATPKRLEIALPVINHSDQNPYKSRRASKSHQWFKSYGHFTERGGFGLLVELHREGPAPAAWAAGLFYLWMASSISLTNTDKFVRSCFSFFCLVLKPTKKTNLDNTV